MLWLLSCLVVAATVGQLSTTVEGSHDLTPQRAKSLTNGIPIPVRRRNGSLASSGSNLSRRGFSSIGQVEFGHGAYFVTIQVGSINLDVALDTGSADLWVMSSDCKTPSCSTSPSYPLSYLSPSFVSINNNNTVFNVTYVDGTSALGFVARENVSINNVTISNQTFALVNSSDLQFQDHVSGILGLGFPRLSTIDQLIDQGDPFFTNVVAQANLTYPFFGLSVTNDTYGSLTFGAIDASVVNNVSQIVWHPVVPFAPPNNSTNQSTYLHWAVNVGSVSIGNVTLDLVPTYTNVTKTSIGLLDIGTEGIFGPYQDVSKLFSTLDVTSRLVGTGQWAIDCSADKSMTFVFGKQNITLFPKDYIIGPTSDQPDLCLSWPQALPPSPEGIDWQFGTPLLRKVYSIFSYGIDQKESPMIGLLDLSIQSNITISSAITSSSGFSSGTSLTNAIASTSTSTSFAFVPTTTVETTVPNFPLSTPSFTAPPYAFNTSAGIPTAGKLVSSGLANATYSQILHPLNVSAIPTILPPVTLETFIITDSAGVVHTETSTSVIRQPSVTLGLPPGVNSGYTFAVSPSLCFATSLATLLLGPWTL